MECSKRHGRVTIQINARRCRIWHAVMFSNFHANAVHRCNTLKGKAFTEMQASVVNRL